MLREIAGTWIVVPLGDRVVDFNGLMTLSETGALLWSKLEQGADESELLAALLEEYAIDRETASADIIEFLGSLETGGVME